MKKELKTKIASNCKELGIENINSIQELRDFIDEGVRPRAIERTTFWYLIRDEFVRIEPLTSKKPTVPYELFARNMQERMASKIFTLNKIRGAVISAPDVVFGQAMSVLERELIKPWYEKAGGVKLTKIDPKGVERIEKIEKEYYNEIKAGNTLIGSGRLFKNIVTDGTTNGSSISFVSPKGGESITVFLTSQRKLVTQQLVKGSESPVTHEIGGSVSGTTFKEIKNGLRSFAKSSGYPLYWNEIARHIERTL